MQRWMPLGRDPLIGPAITRLTQPEIGYELTPDPSVADDLADIARREDYVAPSAKTLLEQAPLLTPKDRR